MSARRDTKRRVNFLSETYVEDRERIEHLASLLMTGHYNVCWCIHDKDFDDDGTLKKSHCHTVIHLDNAMSRSAFVRNFAIRERFVQTCSVGDDIEDLDGALLYMIHADSKSRASGKTPYPLSSIKGPWAKYARERIKHLLSRKANSEKKEASSFLDIQCYIESSMYVTMTDLSRWAAQNGHWACFRRSSGIIRDIIKEHNAYLDKLAADRDKAKWQEELEERRDTEAVYEAIGFRALRQLDFLLAQAGRPSLKLKQQISTVEALVENPSTRGKVNVELIKEMLRENSDLRNLVG